MKFIGKFSDLFADIFIIDLENALFGICHHSNLIDVRSDGTHKLIETADIFCIIHSNAVESEGSDKLADVHISGFGTLLYSFFSSAVTLIFIDISPFIETPFCERFCGDKINAC